MKIKNVDLTQTFWGTCAISNTQTRQKKTIFGLRKTKQPSQINLMLFSKTFNILHARIISVFVQMEFANIFYGKIP